MSLILICGLVKHANDKSNMHKILGSLVQHFEQEITGAVISVYSEQIQRLKHKCGCKLTIIDVGRGLWVTFKVVFFSSLHENRKCSFTNNC